MSGTKARVHTLALRISRRLLIVLLAVYPALFRVRCGRAMIDVLLLSAFATSALVLAAVGLFAALANLVARQAGEFGIRSSLGATRDRLTANVMRRGLGIAGLGLCLGGAGALVVGHFLGRTLYGVGSFDSVTFIATAAIMGCAATLASYLPARRAAGANPLQALQTE